MVLWFHSEIPFTILCSDDLVFIVWHRFEGCDPFWRWVHEFERVKADVYTKYWREESERGNDIIILISKKLKRHLWYLF